ALDPTHVDALNDLGAALNEIGFLGEAIETFRRALAVKPDFIVALFNLGGALLELGEPLAAREAFRRARELAPERADVRFGYCLSFLSVAYADEQEIAESRAAYTRELAALQEHYQSASEAQRAAAANVAGRHLPFYLPYQAQDDRTLQAM